MILNLKDMKLINLGEQNSLLNKFVSEIRDKHIQKDSMRFRKNLERIGEIFAYEISKTLNYEIRDVATPLGIAKCSFYTDNIVLASILRAGLPLHDGLLSFFDSAQNAFVAAYRNRTADFRAALHSQTLHEPQLSILLLCHAVNLIPTCLMSTGNMNLPLFLFH